MGKDIENTIIRRRIYESADAKQKNKKRKNAKIVFLILYITPT